MNAPHRTSVGPYRFGAAPSVTEENLETFAGLIRRPIESSRSVLGGRFCVTHAQIANLGNVVIKHYMRGGFLRNFISNRYLNWGKPRPEREFDILALAKSKGVNVPEPLAFAIAGSVFYRGWLITRKIEGAMSLAELSVMDEERTVRALDEAAGQMARLIEANIQHMDMHPGNVLIDENGAAYLIDFDKADEFTGPRNDLRDRYLQRWRRAVIKHQLPEFLSEELCARLRRNYD